MSAIIVTGILIGVAGTVYLWGIPLIQKNKDVATLENAESFMHDLSSKLKYVVNHGGRDSLRVSVPGILVFDPPQKTIELVVETQGTIYAVGGEHQLGVNVCSLTEGTWGEHEPDTLCRRTQQVGENNYVTVYTLKYIELHTLGVESYAVDLRGGETRGGEGHVVVFQNTGVERAAVNGRELTKTIVSVEITS